MPTNLVYPDVSGRQAAYEGLVLGVGPVGYWPLQEVNDVAIDDLGSLGNDGTFFAGNLGVEPGPIARVLGGSRAFETDGDADHIRLPSSDYGLPGQGFASVFAWVLPAAGQPDARGLVLNVDRGGGASARFTLEVRNDGMFSAGARSATEGLQSGISTDTLSYTEWSHIGAIFDLAADEIRLFLDGALNKTVSVAFSQGTFASTTAVFGGIGSLFSSDGNHVDGFDYKGRSAHVGLVNREVTVAEFKTLYLSGRNGQ